MATTDNTPIQLDFSSDELIKLKEKIKLFEYVEKFEPYNLFNISLRDHFKQYQSVKLYHKFNHELSLNSVFKHYSLIAMKYVRRYPYIFYSDHSIYKNKINLLISCLLIKERPEIANNLIERYDDNLTRYSFLDTLLFQNTNYDSINTNTLSLNTNYNELCNKYLKEMDLRPFGVGELLSILVEIADKALPDISDEDITIAILAKNKKKVSLEKKYIMVLPSLVNRRNINKVLSSKIVDKKYVKISLPIWEQEMCFALKKAVSLSLDMKIEDLETSDRDIIMFKLVRFIIFNKSTFEQYFKEGLSFFNSKLKSINIPFQFTNNIIKEMVIELNKKLNKSIIDKDYDSLSKSFGMLASDFRYRVRYMRLSHKTKLSLNKSAITANFLYYDNSFNINSQSGINPITDFLLKMKKIGINDNEIRNLVSKIFDFKTLFSEKGPTKLYHDFAHIVVPKLLKLFSELPVNRAYTPIYNKFCKLLISELGGSSIKTQLLTEITYLFPKKIDLIYKENFSSLKEMSGILSYPSCEYLSDYEQLEDTNIRFLDTKEGYFRRIKSMSLGSGVKKIIKNYSTSIQNEKNLLELPIIRDKGRVKIGIIPHNYDLSLLAVGVDGVCISPGSDSHKEHHRKECLNLVVYDDKEIFLWGLLIKSNLNFGWFMNNFQGRLPSRLEKIKNEIRDEVIDIMSNIGNIYMVEHSFNAMALHEGLKNVEVNDMTLPAMRLDIHHKPDGKIPPMSFYKVEMAQYASNGIK